MNRAWLLALAAVVGASTAAFADEYSVTTFDGGFLPPPDVPAPGLSNPQQVTVRIAKGLNDRTVRVDLPFTFPFFGKLYDEVSISDDGWLAFGNVATNVESNPAMPDPDAPNAVAAPLWDALDTRTRKGQVLTFVEGTAPNRTFVVAWSHVGRESGNARDDLSFEVLLHETTGVVEFLYDPEASANGLTYTVGIEDESGSRAFNGVKDPTAAGGPLAPLDGNTNADLPAKNQRFTPNAFVITGTITRLRPVASESGLGAEDAPDLVPEPVVGAEVVVVRDDTRERVNASSVLTELVDTPEGKKGKYTAVILGIDGSPTLSVDLLSAGRESRVTNAAGEVRKRRLSNSLTPEGPSHDETTIELRKLQGESSEEAEFRKALNIQQAAFRGFEFARQAFVDAELDDQSLRPDIPQVEIRWVPGGEIDSKYAPAAGAAAARITIADSTANPDPFDDDVVLREYAQHLVATMTTFQGALNPRHVFNPPTPNPATTSSAFLDGFSFWFAAAVQGRAKFIDTKSATTADVFDLETPGSTGATSTAAVAGSLWDLVDPRESDTALDRFEGALPATGRFVFAALDQREKAGDVLAVPTGTAATTSETFFGRWHASKKNDDKPASARIFINARTLPDDIELQPPPVRTFEPNDLKDEAKPLPAATEALTLQLSNEDRFTTTLSGSDRWFAVSFPADTETVVELSLLDAAGVAPVSGVAAVSGASPVVLKTVDLPAGDYVVRVAWISGPAAHYKLTSFEPPTLTVDLPDVWTTGVAFSQTLSVVGGVGRATFTLPAGEAPPGFSITNGNVFGGTTTETGTFKLHFTVTDESGVGPQPLELVTFKVVEGLVLPTTFGIAAGRPGVVTVGRGGASPVWTIVDSTSVTGFTVHTTDPDPRTPPELLPALMLRPVSADPEEPGDSGAARSFTLRASARDTATNASLAAKTTTIVVAAPFDQAPAPSVSAAAPFGYWFDAIGGSRVSLDVRFAGKAPSPRFRALIDDLGTVVALPEGSLRQGPLSLRIGAFAAPRTSRYFLVFDAAAAFDGRIVAARAKVRPPKRFSGRLLEPTADDDGGASLTAVANSRLTLILRSAAFPNAPLPDAVELIGPDGAKVPLNPGRREQGGRRKVIRGVKLALHGEYRLVLPPGAEGPILFDAVVTPPPRGGFVAD